MATPIDELANARFGSRPAYRPGAKAGIEGIRAIPWGFGWTQIRLMLTGWLGVGTALGDEVSTRAGLRRVQRMAETWPFCRRHAGEGGDGVRENRRRDRPRVRRVTSVATSSFSIAWWASTSARSRRYFCVRGHRHLVDDTPVLQSAIALRNPYVDPLSLLQISLLRRKHVGAGKTEREKEAIDDALATTLSGIAQGLRNTG